jgi:hypothetical protein
MPPEVRAREAQSILLFASMLSKVGLIYGSNYVRFVCCAAFKADSTLSVI